MAVIAMHKYCGTIFVCDLDPLSHSRLFLLTWVNFNLLIWMLFLLYSFSYFILWYWLDSQPYPGGEQVLLFEEFYFLGYNSSQWPLWESEILHRYFCLFLVKYDFQCRQLEPEFRIGAQNLSTWILLLRERDWMTCTCAQHTFCLLMRIVSGCFTISCH
jgi:hypothetical protein